VFLWRRPDRAALVRDLAALAEELDGPSPKRLDRLSHSVHIEERGRRLPDHGGVRLGIVATSLADLRDKLGRSQELAARADSRVEERGLYLSDAPPARPEQVCFLFPGQGAQYVGMLEDLMRHGALGSESLTRADEVLAGLLPRPVSSYIYPRHDLDEAANGRHQAALDDTRIAQPAIGVMSLFAMDVLLQFGLRPAFVAGHSYGEYVALCAAGLTSREDLLRTSALRSRAVYEAGRECPGGMVVVAASEADTRAALAELGIPAEIANVNAPRHVVVAGPVEAIDAVLEQLPGRGFVVWRVSVTSAFHTAVLEPSSIAFKRHLETVPMALPRIPVYGNATAAPYPADIGAIRHQMAYHLARPVRFVELLLALHRDGARVFVEVGPARILTGLVGRTLNGRPHAALALDMRAQSSWLRLAVLLARTHALGLPIDLSAWFEPFSLNGSDPRPLSDSLAPPGRSSRSERSGDTPAARVAPESR